MEGKWKREEEERVGSPALLHLACSHNTKWIVYLSVPSFLHFSLLLLLHVISVSFSLSMWPFCFMLTGANGRQMEAGRRRRRSTSRFPGSPVLSLLSQYKVEQWETPCLSAEKRNGVKGDDRNTFSIFVFPLLVYSALFLHCSLSFSLSLSLSPSLHLDFSCQPIQPEGTWKAEAKHESAPLLSCTFITSK